MSRTLCLGLLAMSGLILPGALACAGQISPLAPRPAWSLLEAYQKTITRVEFTRLINEVYTPDGGFWDFAKIDDGKVVVYSNSAKTEPLFTLHFAPDDASCAPLPYTYKTQAVSSDPTRPLKGIKIALDPGHIGGDWAKLEARYFKLGDDPPVEEAKLNMITCQRLAERLEADGAEIIWAKKGFEPTTSLRPESLHREAIAALALSESRAAKLARIGFIMAAYLQTLNDGTTIPRAGQALTAAPNPDDSDTVNLADSLVKQVASAMAAAHHDGATRAQTQAAVNAVLAPDAVIQTAADVAAYTPSYLFGIEMPRFAQHHLDHSAVERRIDNEAALLFYRVAEIRARGDIVNKQHPDLTICVHYNADDWGDPDHPSLVPQSHLVIFTNGAYERKTELPFDDYKYDLLRKLLDRTAVQEERGCAFVGREMLDTFKYPPEAYIGYFAHHVTDVPSVYARDLLANRLYHGPVIYCEGPYMNARDAYYRIIAGDYLGLRTIQGRSYASIYRDYAASVERGVLKYFGVK